MWVVNLKLLLEPFTWSNNTWAIINKSSRRGSKKCSLNIICSIGLLTEKLPQTQTTRLLPIGKTVNKLVITVAPHNDICPHTSTYPKKAIAINRI